MTVRSIFIIWKHPLFYDSVRLLLEHPAIKWVGETSDCETARHQIAVVHPEIILIEEESQSPSEETLSFLETTPWPVIIIGLSLVSNQLIVYRREQCFVEKDGDLLQVVLGK